MARETVINSISVSDTPSTLRKKFEYSGTNVLYAGSTRMGAATDDDLWTINKFTYDGSNNVTDIATAFGAWDNRASLVYT